MASGSFRFAGFHLDPHDRRLRRDDEPVEVNARYLDALALLVSEAGRLVSKDRFLEEVWRGVPVTDEALTQCIKTLRRQLGDDAARPRFIETVPKHGYRFIAPVERVGDHVASPSAAAAAPSPTPAPQSLPGSPFLLIGGAGTIGGGVAGLLGGLIYGFAAASAPAAMGSASVLIVLVWITLVLALIGGAGVAFGIAAADRWSGGPSPWRIAGGAVGGMLVGAVVKLLGNDAFNLLFGRAPGDITGAGEGALLGAAVGLGAWLALRRDGAPGLRRGVAAATLAGASAGILIVLLGGQLMGGSLDLLARQFPDSRLSFDAIGALVGETGYGPVARLVTGGLEGLLFGGCVVGAMILAHKRRRRAD